MSSSVRTLFYCSRCVMDVDAGQLSVINSFLTNKKWLPKEEPIMEKPGISYM